MLPKDPNARRAFAAATGMTSSICVGIFCLAMAAKNPDNGFWFWASIASTAAAIGSGYDLYRVIKSELNDKSDVSDVSNDKNNNDKPGPKL